MTVWNKRSLAAFQIADYTDGFHPPLRAAMKRVKKCPARAVALIDRLLSDDTLRWCMTFLAPRDLAATLRTSRRWRTTTARAVVAIGTRILWLLHAIDTDAYDLLDARTMLRPVEVRNDVLRFRIVDGDHVKRWFHVNDGFHVDDLHGTLWCDAFRFGLYEEVDETRFDIRTSNDDLLVARVPRVSTAADRVVFYDVDGKELAVKHHVVSGGDDDQEEEEKMTPEGVPAWMPSWRYTRTVTQGPLRLCYHRESIAFDGCARNATLDVKLTALFPLPTEWT